MENNFTKGAIALLASSVLFGGVALAAVPPELIYEGRMISKTGEVLTDSYVLRFSFWKSADFVSSDLSAGGIDVNAPNYAGWQETLPLSFNELGHFSVILGKTNSLAGLDFATYKFLQVEIKKTSEPDSAYKLMDIDGDNGANTTDRKTVASVPYARHADEASSSNNANFAIDANNAVGGTGTGSINLHFGGALNKMLSYDLDAKRFVFNDNLEVKGDILVSGKVDGVDVSELGTTVGNLTNNIQNLGSIAGETFVIDNNDTGGNITLQFGNTLKESLTWDDSNGRFDLSDDLNVQGNITLLGTVDGVDISDMKTLVDANTANIAGQAGNLTSINQTLATYATQLAQNSTDHGGLTTQITNLAGQVTTQGSQIQTLTNAIAENTTKLDTLTNTVTAQGTTLATHTNQINTLTAELATQGAKLATLTTQVTDNTAKILDLTGKVNTNTADINALKTAVQAHDSAISTLQTRVDANSLNITALQAKDAAHDLSIAELETKVANHAIELANHATTLATHSNQITAITADLADIKAKNTAQDAILLTHTTDINALKAKDIVLENAIAGNTTDINALKAKDIVLENAIAGNTADINALKAKDIVLENAITALNTQITNNTNAIAANTTDIANLKPLVTQNTNDIATLKPQVAQNIADIADLTARMVAVENKNATQDTTLSTHATQISTLNGQVATINTITGDGEYDSANIISFGDSLTDAISKIDAFLGTPKALSIHIPLAEVVTLPDGTNNKMNVYHASETGPNPHQFLKAVSTKTALQDMGLQFKVQLPKDLKKLTSFKLFYKAEGSATESAFDITLKDTNGNAAFSETALSNSVWTGLTKTIGSSFTPTGGDFVLVTITAKSANKKAILMGDMVIEYEANR